MLGIDEHAQALPTVKSAGPCDRAAQLISLYFELDVSFKRFETPWGNGDRDCARCVVGGQDGAEDADDDGIGELGVRSSLVKTEHLSMKAHCRWWASVKRTSTRPGWGSSSTHRTASQRRKAMGRDCHQSARSAA